MVRGRGVAVALLAATAPAWAHAALVRANPPARSQIRVAPVRAQLWFSERLEPTYSTMSVWRDQTQIDRRDARVTPEDARSLTVALAPLSPGTYVVKYRVLSVDSHVVDGSYSFTVTDRAPTR